MSLGERIFAARQAKGWSQAKLAENIGVSTEAVSKWENGVYQPGPDKLSLLETLLDLPLFDEDGNARDARLFEEAHMSAFLKGKISSLELTEAASALDYAKERHRAQLRKPEAAGVPYINHPLTMACHAFALGLEDDVLISALLLHDVVEDCGVTVPELPFSPEVRRLVSLVTKPDKPYDEQAYYHGIEADPKACLIKCIDRCNNLSTMALGFSSAKIARYVAETELYFPPLLKAIKAYPGYNNAAWLLRYQIAALLETAKRIR